MLRRFAFAFGLFGTVALVGGAALAAAPEPWRINLQDPVTQIAQEIYDLHHALVYIISLISVFVLGLLVYVMWRFSEKRNPTPSRTSHNTLVEIVWTVVPVVILVGIAVPSLKLLYFADVVPKADMTIKAIGHQWYWSYVYPDHGDIQFDSSMLSEEELKPGMRRLLEVDNSVVVPINTTVRVQVTAEDVLHAWTVPAFGVKVDANPGKLNEVWFKAEREGTYYGQCSELCGTRHGFMPIRVEVVSKDKFDAWVARSRARAGVAPADVDRVFSLRQIDQGSHPHPNPPPSRGRESDAAGPSSPSPSMGEGGEGVQREVLAASESEPPAQVRLRVETATAAQAR